MTERITKTNLTRREGAVNSMLHDGIYVSSNARNGYTALDLYDRVGCIRCLTVGTKREVYDYMGAMIEALSIVGRDA